MTTTEIYIIKFILALCSGLIGLAIIMYGIKSIKKKESLNPILADWLPIKAKGDMGALYGFFWIIIGALFIYAGAWMFINY